MLRPLLSSCLRLLTLVPSACLWAQAPLEWRRLPDIPDQVGFAAPFAGITNGALLVAGGANFPEVPPWLQGRKVWHDRVFILETPDAAWQSGFKLPHPLGYGVSLTTPEGVLCIGGSDEERHHDSVFLLRWEAGGLKQTSLPPLPQPCAMACGAVLNGRAYIAGGLEKPDATTAMHTFWSLDLGAAEKGWQNLPPWPGPPRMLAVAAVQDESFYLFSGAALQAQAGGAPERQWLKDAYRFTPGQGWQRVADLPRVAVAAPSPAPVLRDHRILILGGDDGAQAKNNPATHRGFPKDVLAYDTRKDAWSEAGQLPFSLVTTNVVIWNGSLVIPGGEEKPGVRSTSVWSGTPPSP